MPTSSRQAVMPQTILRPTAFPTGLRGFETALQDRELFITRNETMAEDTPNNAAKRQTLLDQASSEIRTQLLFRGAADFAVLRGLDHGALGELLRVELSCRSGSGRPDGG